MTHVSPRLGIISPLANEEGTVIDFPDRDCKQMGQNDSLVKILEAANLRNGEDEDGNNLHRCYEALVAAGILPSGEMPFVEAWLDDITSITPNNRPEGSRSVP